MSTAPMPQYLLDTAIVDADRAWRDAGKDQPFSQYLARAIAAAMAARWPRQADPMFWVRLRSDGGFEGPIHSDVIEDVRKRSGAWLPLYLGSWSTVPAHIMAILRAVHRRPSDANVWLDAISDVLRAEHARQAAPQHERNGLDAAFGMPPVDMARFLSDTGRRHGQEGGAA